MGVENPAALVSLEDLIGANDDSHGNTTLFGKLMMLIDHTHTTQKVYPTQAEEVGGNEGDGVTLTTASGNWALGTIAEIVPANKITNEFDIHEVIIEDVSVQDKTYELVLYYGADDIECGRSRFSADTHSGGKIGMMMTALIPANSRIRARLAIEDGSGKTAKVSIRYHEY